MNPNAPGYDYGGGPDPRDKLAWSQFPLYVAQFRRHDGEETVDVDWDHIWWTRELCDNNVETRNRIHRAQVYDDATAEHAKRLQEVREHNTLVDAGLRAPTSRLAEPDPPPANHEDVVLTVYSGFWETATIYAQGHGNILVVPLGRPDDYTPLILQGSSVDTEIHQRLHGSLAANILIGFHDERIRAHRKHSDKPGGSMETKHWDAPDWSDVLGEELGEINRARNDHRHGLLTHDEYRAQLRNELIQLGAMTEAWTAAIDNTQLPDDPSHTTRHNQPDTPPQPTTPNNQPTTQDTEPRLDVAHRHAVDTAHHLTAGGEGPGPWLLYSDGRLTHADGRSSNPVAQQPPEGGPGVVDGATPVRPEFERHVVVVAESVLPIRQEVARFLEVTRQRRNTLKSNLKVKVWAHPESDVREEVIAAVNAAITSDRWSDAAETFEYDWAVEVQDDPKTVLVGPRRG